MASPQKTTDVGEPKSLERLMQSLHELSSSGDFSDLIITCDSKEYKVHKAIVCPRSEFFRKACTGGFEEAVTNKICLDDDDPIAVDLMLHYLYHANYKVTTKSSESEQSSKISNKQQNPVQAKPDGDINVLYTHAKVYEVAEKYNIPELKVVAMTKFVTELNYRAWSQRDIISIAHYVYGSTVESDRELRSRILNFIVNSFAKFDDKSIREMQKEPQLTFDILDGLKKRNPSLTLGAVKPRKVSQTVWK